MAVAPGELTDLCLRAVLSLEEDALLDRSHAVCAQRSHEVLRALKEHGAAEGEVRAYACGGCMEVGAWVCGGGVRGKCR